MAEKIHFTDAVIRDLLPPQEKRIFYRDDKESGLIVQITHTGHKTFYLEKGFNGMMHRYFIGLCDITSVAEARLKASEIKVNLSNGIDPLAEKTIKKEELTLQELFKIFTTERPNIKARTTHDYIEMWNGHLKDKFGNMRLSDITLAMLREFHRKKSMHAPYRANRLITFIKAMYNYAIKNEYYDNSNPAFGIVLNKEEPRSRYLSSDELKRFFRALKEVPEHSYRDAILMLMFSGVRKGNVLDMAWKDVDLVDKVWHIPETKTTKNSSIPLVDVAVELLAERKRMNTQKSPWVFWSDRGTSGHINGLNKTLNHILKRANITNFRVHDLRHNFGTYLAANGATPEMIKRSLIQKTIQSGLVYTNLDTEHVRRITNITANGIARFIQTEE